MPMGFSNVSQNFVQGQVTASVAGTPTGGTLQLQTGQNMAHAGTIFVRTVYFVDQIDCFIVLKCLK